MVYMLDQLSNCLQSLYDSLSVCRCIHYTMEFINSMRQQHKLIFSIGHRVKSVCWHNKVLRLYRLGILYTNGEMVLDSEHKNEKLKMSCLGAI